MYMKPIVRTANVSETRENLADLLDAVEAGGEVVITRRNRPVAKLVAVEGSMRPFLDRSQLRSEIPAMTTSAAQTMRELRDEARY